jgi:hypothetical protein
MGMCMSAVVPSHETWFISSWILPRYVESTVVSSELGTSQNHRVSILLLIRSEELILLLIRPKDTLLWTVLNHSSLQVRC